VNSNPDEKKESVDQRSMLVANDRQESRVIRDFRGHQVRSVDQEIKSQLRTAPYEHGGFWRTIAVVKGIGKNSIKVD
jgi:hypothetical protein